MRIDVADGSIELGGETSVEASAESSGEVVREQPAASLRISAAISLAAFCSSALSTGATAGVGSGAHRSFALSPTITGGWSVVLYFAGEALLGADLADADPRFGTGWDDWSIEKERARKAAHDEHLRAWGVRTGSDRDPPWGEVRSTLDPRSGSATIVLRYGYRA